MKASFTYSYQSGKMIADILERYLCWEYEKPDLLQQMLFSISATLYEKIGKGCFVHFEGKRSIKVRQHDMLVLQHVLGLFQEYIEDHEVLVATEVRNAVQQANALLVGHTSS